MKISKIIKEEVRAFIREMEETPQQKYAREYREMQQSPEYQGTVRYIDPNLKNPKDIRDNNPSLWKLFGQAWQIIQVRARNQNDVFYLTSRQNDLTTLKKMGLEDSEVGIIQQAYAAAQTIKKKTKAPDMGYGNSRYHGD